MSSATPTEIYLPDTLPYPIKILSLTIRPNESIRSNQRLLNYSYASLTSAHTTISTAPDDDEDEFGVGSSKRAIETRFGTWDATFEGELSMWKVKTGEVVSRQRAKDRAVLLLIEPCKHGVQVNGLCALCGMDMENFDYTGRPESSRANIQMTHSATGPTVSFEEAQRLEHERAEHLLKSRKLSLIVDLDQTIVHATVDPTVGEWILEGEAWEARRAERLARRAAAASGNGSGVNGGENGDAEESTTPKSAHGEGIDGGDEDEEDEVNPNWAALKDVKKFHLAPEIVGGPKPRPGSKDKGKDKSIEIEGCLYYVKPRPGWQTFLNEMSKKYEMHVYTMGTRAYAEEVCAAIDPDSRIFGGRILSRDESGSLTQKSLRRLFPVDTSMVVIIDDRADVWEWSPNLVKVVPYDFFVGIGDINSAFLPKLDPASPANIPPSPTANTTASTVSNTQPTIITIPESGSEVEEGAVSPLLLSSGDVASESSEPTVVVTEEMITQNTLALEAQVEERPLAKKQEELDESADDEVPNEVEAVNEQSSEGILNGTGNVSEDQNGVDLGTSVTVASSPELSPTILVATPSPKPRHAHHKALLKDDDTELQRVGYFLSDIHRRFYEAYESGKKDESIKLPKRRGSVAKPPPNQPREWDVRKIIPRLRMDTFAGLHLLFSGVIPTNPPVDHETTEVWKMARAFGAVCHREISRQVTHVVTSKRGTRKVEMAHELGGMYVVWMQWFTDSIARWTRQEERPYIVDDTHPPTVPTVSSPPSDPNAISTDTDPEGTVDEEADGAEADTDGAGRGTGGAEGNAEEGPTSASVPGRIGTPALVAEVEGLDAADLNLEDVNWEDVNDEVELAMMESDSEMDDPDGDLAETDADDDQDSRRSSPVLSDDEGNSSDRANSVNGSTSGQLKRKRVPSLTPSEINIALSASGRSNDNLRSPLAKRKKVVADRRGTSKLKETMTADDLDSASSSNETSDSAVAGGRGSRAASVTGSPKVAMMDDVQEEETEDDSSEDEEMSEEDDFLAREMAEWG